ncbi:MAG: Ppx/GppA phosphatase family protein [Asticcacaulis sp.]
MYQAPSKGGPSQAAPMRRADNGGGLSRQDTASVYAALDLGTNNCRLMIAHLHNSQFRIIEAFSRIVRLGEGLTASGKLNERAMERALKALKICADKIEKRGAVHIRAVATQACRIAANGAAFIARIERETGLHFTIISPEEEAHLAVTGCTSLLDSRDLSPPARTALVMDVGGGSTELSWVELSPMPPFETIPPPQDSQVQAQHNALKLVRKMPRPAYWVSIPIGVVNLAESFPVMVSDSLKAADVTAWFESMVDTVSQAVRAFTPPEALRSHFDRGEAYIVGTSGAITSLAGVHLGLERYDRSKVDGLWMSHDHIQSVIKHLLSVGHAGREREPCIGKDRADLVLAGAAILEAVYRLWPCERLRVADRGLREGLLLSMAKKKTRRRRRRARKTATVVA